MSLAFSDSSISLISLRTEYCSNSRERKRHEDWAALGLIGLLWKKDAVYTLIEYDDGIDIQKIILDFNKNANYAQGLIYKKMLEYRNKEK